MPTVFNRGGYKFYFWSKEINEGVHIHVAKGEPTENGTKFWLSKNGLVILAHNRGRIPHSDMGYIIETIYANMGLICAEWKARFGGIKYYN